MGKNLSHSSGAGQVTLDTVLFDQERFNNALATSFLGRALLAIEETDSTNSYLSSRFEKEPDKRLAVVAEKQTRGRGRFGRTWDSVSGRSLTFSFVWPVPESYKDASPGVLTLAVGVALAEAVYKISGAKALLKYPNDLYMNEKKVGGILAEQKGGDKGRFVVVGVGVNVNNHTEDYESEDVKNNATSILDVVGESVSREDIMAEFFNQMEPLILSLENNKNDLVMVRYRKLSNTVGREVTLTTAGEEFTGHVIDITDKGELAVDVDGKRKLFVSGEVSFKKKDKQLL